MIAAIRKFSPNPTGGTGTVTINLVAANLIPYTPETEYIDPMEIPKQNWRKNGVGIRRNGDYDNEQNFPDWTYGTASGNENDLIQLDIDVTPITGVEYRLKMMDGNDIRLWESKSKGGYPLPTYATNGVLITDDKTVYAEYISAGDDSVTFELVAIETRTNKTLLAEMIVFRPFESVTAAFVGENEQAGDEEKSPGINDWVKKQLLDGYDVHVWDDGHDLFQSDEADSYGRGPAHDVLVNAINNHGQSEVALVGYSHGGGTVYNMAWRLHNNYTDSNDNTITEPYQLVFTSYIDAIRNAWFWDGEIENRRPLGSQYHLGQYQTNTSFPHGGPLEDSAGEGEDVDRSSLGVTHRGESAIDTNTVVQELLTDVFEREVTR